MNASSLKKFNSPSYLNFSILNNGPTTEDTKSPVPELPVVKVKVNQDDEQDGPLGLVTPQSIFSTGEESVDKMHDKLLLEKMEVDQQTGLLLGGLVRLQKLCNIQM